MSRSITQSPRPSYRTTGNAWVPAIPATWDESKLRWVARISAGGTPDRARADYWEGGSIPWLASGEVNKGRIFNADAHITPAGLHNSSARWVPAGSVLVALAGQGKTKGMAATLEFPATCNQSLAAIVPDRRRLQHRFLHYYLVSQYRNLRAMAGGDLRDGLNLSMVGDVRCPLPALDEQKRIVRYLDRKTAAIEEVIDAKQRLLSLLGERQMAKISECVARGVSPAVPTKASGVPLIGPIPQHWRVASVRRLVEYATSGSRAWSHRTTDDESAPAFLQSGNVRPGLAVEWEDTSHVWPPNDAESRRTRVRAGDVLVTITGARTGAVGVIRDVPRDGYVNQHVALLRPRASAAVGSFLGYALLASPSAAQMASAQYGGTKQGLGLDDVLRVTVAVPPPDEQRIVAAELDAAVHATSALCGLISDELSHLLEYRHSLTAAAVTGLIEIPEESDV